MELLENCSVLGNSETWNQVAPLGEFRELGWLELLEMWPGTNWYQFPSSSSSSSCPATCHLADALALGGRTLKRRWKWPSRMKPMSPISTAGLGCQRA